MGTSAVRLQAGEKLRTGLASGAVITETIAPVPEVGLTQNKVQVRPSQAQEVPKVLTPQKNQQTGFIVVLIEGAKIMADALLRAFGRGLEPKDNPLFRGLIRGPFELCRKYAEVIYSNFLDGKKTLINSKEAKVASTRAFEHVPATMLFESNVYEGLGKIGAGFVNVLLRLGTRYGSHKAGAIDFKDFLGVGPVKEVIVKTLGRVGGLVFTENPFISRVFEQSLINTGINTKLWKYIEGNSKKEDEVNYFTAA